MKKIAISPIVVNLHDKIICHDKKCYWIFSNEIK